MMRNIQIMTKENMEIQKEEKQKKLYQKKKKNHLKKQDH